jgi:hypothetical protein
MHGGLVSLRRKVLSCFLFFLLLLSLVSGFCHVDDSSSVVVPHINFVSIGIMVDNGSSFDLLYHLLQHLDFHNLTFVIWDNSAWDYILLNSTRVSILKSYGILIPRLDYMQTYSIEARKARIDSEFSDFLKYVGYYPEGIFDFIPDTWTLNYIRKAYNCSYFQGYCFDEYGMDYITEVGGWQLPYYASSVNCLVPSTGNGIVVFPHNIWDWSFGLPDTLNACTNGYQRLNTHIGNVMEFFNYNTSPAKAYWLSLINSSLADSSPFGFVSVEFEFTWLLNYKDTGQNLLSTEEDWLHTLLQDDYEFWTYQAVANWFDSDFSSNPVYRINFVSPYQGSARACEWYWSVDKRVFRENGRVLSYYNYTRPDVDPYLTSVGFISFSLPSTYANSIDASLYGCRVFDSVTFGNCSVAYRGALAEFDGSSFSSGGGIWYLNPVLFVLVSMVVVCLLVYISKKHGLGSQRKILRNS